ncbi:hypothetical protein JQX13_33660 [Archangium violaceum]|uniref:kelch repeat-containing protein n=1 Tax=Archangium violaceum TaxID=83451 RepID=UPI00193BC3A9|nr:kelch repeat-containing protein [Archangium violaceum]QRK05125.1 hypothetical protein JQX13_33660 [Archangium violaceum]
MNSSTHLCHGKWTVLRSGTPNSTHDATSQSLFLTRVGGYSGGGIYMLARTPLETRKWEASFRYRIGGRYQGGADGLAFLFYKKGGYTPAGGGFLGFNPAYVSQPGYGIVIDNYFNPDWDPSASYIGLIANSTHSFANKLAYVNDPRTEDSLWHSRRVRFMDGTVSVYLDGSLLFSHEMAAPDYTYDGVGFSSGIGLDQNYHQIDDFVLTDLEEPSPPPVPVWNPTGRMNLERGLHTSTLLRGGKVLVVGGFNNAAELYDPASGTWSFTGSASRSRLLPTATALKDGRVLITGGENDAHSLETTELYEPATGSWKPAANLSTGRRDHTATLLSDGRVLVTGGYSDWFGILASSELYDPATRTWADTANLGVVRYDHTSTLLEDGRVLTMGGFSTVDSASAELFGPGASE